jgi:PAS domain S-box-containing protein
MESDPGRIVNSLPGFVWTAFADGQIDFLSQSWPEYTGLGIEESCGRGWQAAVHQEDLPRLLTAWRSDVAANASVEAEIRLRRADGIYRWFLFRTNPSVFAAGRVVKWCGLITDIDERVQVQERNEALLGGEKRLLEMIARGRPMSDVLEDLCGLVESTASGSYCVLYCLTQLARESRE